MTSIDIPFGLNTAAASLVGRCAADPALRLATTNVAGATVLDFGVHAAGSMRAGVELAQVCLAGLGTVAVESGTLDGRAWPSITVQSDWPVASCLLSQYAGWQIAAGKFFAMGSGPMRAVANVEPLFKELNFTEHAAQVVGVLESAKLPDESVVAWLVEKLHIAPEQLILCVARTASVAGTVQVVARSLETALHKLHELKFDVTRVQSGYGSAPLPPIAADDLAGIGLTNDAILYGGSVTLWVSGDDASIEAVGPKVPSSASPDYGRPFRQLFEEVGGDFYKLDPMLFSPAEVTICNLSTGRVHRYGQTNHEVLKMSFGF